MGVNKKGLSLTLLASMLGLSYQGVSAEEVQETEYTKNEWNVEQTEIEQEDLAEESTEENVEENVEESTEEYVEVELLEETEVILEEEQVEEELLEEDLVENAEGNLEEELLEEDLVESTVDYNEIEEGNTEEVIVDEVEEWISEEQEDGLGETLESTIEDVNVQVLDVNNSVNEQETTIESTEEGDIQTDISTIQQEDELVENDGANDGAEEIEIEDLGAEEFEIEDLGATEFEIEELESEEDVNVQIVEVNNSNEDKDDVLSNEEDLADFGLIREDDFIDGITEIKEDLDHIELKEVEKGESTKEDFIVTEKGRELKNFKPLETLPEIVDAGTALNTHRVQFGDTLYRIALNNGLSLARLKTINKLESDLILPGQTLIVEEKVSNNDEYIAKVEENKKGYTIEYGDSLYRIAVNHGVTISELKKANNLTSDMIYPGQQLTIPTNKVLETKYGKVEDGSSKYTVESGNSLWGIATKYGVTIYELKQWNQDVIENDTIHPGQVLTIKKREEITINRPKPSSTSYSTVTPEIAKSVVDKVVKEAEKYLGTPYVWGGRKPGGFDCSGLMQHIFLESTGHQIGWWTGDQQYAGPVKSIEQAQRGDLYFWGDLGNTYHVALATGGGNYIHAPQPGDVVKYAKVNNYFKPTFAISMAKYLK